MSYPVMNLGRRYRMGGAAEGAASPSFGSLSQIAKSFKDSIDNGYSDADVLAQQFNNQLNQAISNGEDPLDLMKALKEAGIPSDYLHNMRPDLYTDPFTNTYYGHANVQPPGTTRPGTPTKGGATNPFQPQGVKANQGVTPAQETASWNEEYGPAPAAGPAYAPVATGGSSGNAHGYEEEAAQYKQQMEEFQKASQKAQEEANAQIKASNESTAAELQKIKEKYESGNPNAVCGPGEFWDGHQCRGLVQGRGGLISQAMNLGPSGGATAFTMGNRFPVVNL